MIQNQLFKVLSNPDVKIVKGIEKIINQNQRFKDTIEGLESENKQLFMAWLVHKMIKEVVPRMMASIDNEYLYFLNGFVSTRSSPSQR